jgi:hypothetical protein
MTKLKAFYAFVTNPKVQAQAHKLVTAALALYVALHRAGL